MNALLEAFGAALTTTVKFLLAFNFLVSHEALLIDLFNLFSARRTRRGMIVFMIWLLHQGTSGGRMFRSDILSPFGEGGTYRLQAVPLWKEQDLQWVKTGSFHLSSSFL